MSVLDDLPSVGPLENVIHHNTTENKPFTKLSTPIQRTWWNKSLEILLKATPIAHDPAPKFKIHFCLLDKSSCAGGRACATRSHTTYARANTFLDHSNILTNPCVVCKLSNSLKLWGNLQFKILIKARFARTGRRKRRPVVVLSWNNNELSHNM